MLFSFALIELETCIYFSFVILVLTASEYFSSFLIQINFFQVFRLIFYLISALFQLHYNNFS